MKGPDQFMLAEGDLKAFWTAYEPLDISGESVDPLGFLAGYVALADRILPGFTTITTVPRYLSLLCAALPRREERDAAGLGAAEWRKAVMARVTRLERAWALACGLAELDPGIGGRATDGLRGVRAVHRVFRPYRQAETVSRKTFSLAFSLLSNQVRYGAVGGYSTMLDALHLADMTALVLRPLGERLAACFRPPDWLDVAALTDRQSLDADELCEWGRKAHCGRLSGAEARILRTALEGGEEQNCDDQTRWAMLLLIRDCSEAEGEGAILDACLDRLRLGRGSLSGDGGIEERLATALGLVEPYERFYQAAQFLFDSLRAGAQDDLSVDLGRVCARKPVLAAAAAIRRAASRLLRKFGATSSAAGSLGPAHETLSSYGMLALARKLVTADSAVACGEVLVRRHEEVQQSKFEGGAAKAAWIRMDAAGASRARLTARDYALDPDAMPASWSRVPRHSYRTTGALRFIRLCRIRQAP